MTVTVLAFGITKDILGDSSVKLDISGDQNMGALKWLLEEKYPKLKQLTSLLIALNNEYATAPDLINEGDEIALIPPVSGG